MIYTPTHARAQSTRRGRRNRYTRLEWWHPDTTFTAYPATYGAYFTAYVLYNWAKLRSPGYYVRRTYVQPTNAQPELVDVDGEIMVYLSRVPAQRANFVPTPNFACLSGVLFLCLF